MYQNFFNLLADLQFSQILYITDWAGALVYLRVTLLLSSIHLSEIFCLWEGGTRLNHNVLRAFCVRCAGRLGQIHELVSFLATKSNPIQMLPHCGH